MQQPEKHNQFTVNDCLIQYYTV